MPTYEFRCPNGHTFDRFFSKMSDAPSEVACPECGAEAARQISGGAGLQFKGSGFYLTDYGKNAHRGGGGSKPSGSDSSGSSGASGSSGGSSDKPSGGSSGASGSGSAPKGD